MIAPLDEFGVYLDGFGFLSGQYAEAVPPAVTQALEARGLLYRAQPYTHRYPVCWRCHTQLVFRVVDEWFISMDGPRTAEASERTAGDELPPLREQVMAAVRKVRWLPSWGLERELDWLRHMGDWMISKKRYWGLALPIWRCDACGWFDVLGSETELRQRAVSGWEEFEGHSPHRPWIDAVKLSCPQCGAVASRVPDVGNVWLDAGIVPYSTLGYRQDRATWAQWFPADFITESFPGQFRNWFYALLTMSTVLEDREPFRTVLGLRPGARRAGPGDAQVLGQRHRVQRGRGAGGGQRDALDVRHRQPGANLNFGYGLADEVKRRLLTLWNVYAFFCNYARLDGFNPLAATATIEPAARPALDRWVLGQLNALVDERTRRYDDFDPAGAGRRLEEFVDDLSNWYLRRGRQRYWKSEADADRTAAYLTLWEVLTTLSKLLAPSMPFLAEAMYQNLVRRVDPQAPSSVHHCPLAGGGRRPDRSPARRGDGPGAPGGRAGTRRAHPQGAHPGPPTPPGAPGAGEEPGRAGTSDRLSEQVLEELNVKRLEVIDDTSQLLSYRVKPDFRLLGPLFGPKLNAVVRALQSANAAELARHHAAGEAVTVVVEGRQVEVPAEDFEVEVTDAPGFAVVEEGGYLVALDTRLTPELVEEGLVRELVHRLNSMRKDAGFRLEDRIVTYYQADERLSPLFEQYGDVIRQETLSLRLEPLTGPRRRARRLAHEAAHAEQVRLDGHLVTLSVQRAGSLV